MPSLREMMLQKQQEERQILAKHIADEDIAAEPIHPAIEPLEKPVQASSRLVRASPPAVIINDARNLYGKPPFSNASDPAEPDV